MGGAADLRNLRAATRSIASNLNGTSPIIVNKSTSPIGTGETIESIVSEALTEKHRTPRIVSNPEFLRQGHAVWDFFHPDRIVVGAKSRDDALTVAEPVREPRRADDRHRPPDGRDDQVRRELVPRDADLVHQRDRAPVRRDRHEHRPGGRGGLVRPAHRPVVLPPRHRVRRELPAQGRRGAALHRRDVRRGHARPVGRPGGQRRAADERGPPPARAPRDAREQGHRGLGPDVQGRHRGRAPVARHGRRGAAAQRGRDRPRVRPGGRARQPARAGGPVAGAPGRPRSTPSAAPTRSRS